MAQFNVINEISTYLLNHIKNELSSNYNSIGNIAFAAPSAKNNNASLCLYLYSIGEYSGYREERQAFMEGSGSQNIPLPVFLRYVVYFNKDIPISLDYTTQHEIWGKLLELFHRAPLIHVKEVSRTATILDEPADLRLIGLSDHEKQELWTGFSSPFCTSLFLEVSPLLINGLKPGTGRVAEFNSYVNLK